MPLHLLGKKSWNVYNAENIAKVKADEAAAAAREAADEQRMQELDAERRAALLRGRTPPPLPNEDTQKDDRSRRSEKGSDVRGHDHKRRRLAGEDDTDRDIRLATSATAPREGNDEGIKVLQLRKPASDAPLTDNAGNINLFPVDLKEAIRREKNAEAEKEKKKKDRAFEDQYTMRFSNAAGKGGLEQPWYSASAQQNPQSDGGHDKSISHPGFESKDVWGNEDPLRKEREQARIVSNDPFAFMQKAQAQLKKSKEDKKKWAQERDRDLQELRGAQERDLERDSRGKRQKRSERDTSEDRHHKRHVFSRHSPRHRSRSSSPNRRHGGKHKYRHERRRVQDSNDERERRHSYSDQYRASSGQYEPRDEKRIDRSSRYSTDRHYDRR